MSAKRYYTKLHHFYDTMCQDCGDFNYAKRFQTADLEGQGGHCPPVPRLRKWLTHIA